MLHIVCSGEEGKCQNSKLPAWGGYIFFANVLLNECRMWQRLTCLLTAQGCNCDTMGDAPNGQNGRVQPRCLVCAKSGKIPKALAYLSSKQDVIAVKCEKGRVERTVGMEEAWWSLVLFMFYGFIFAESSWFPGKTTDGTSAKQSNKQWFYSNKLPV